MLTTDNKADAIEEPGVAINVGSGADILFRRSVDVAVVAAYVACFLSGWWLSTRLEVIPGTVSWFAPAGVRFLAMLLVAPTGWWRLWLAEFITILGFTDLSYDYSALSRALLGSAMPFLCYALPNWVLVVLTRHSKTIDLEYVTRCTLAALVGAALSGGLLANNLYLNGTVAADAIGSTWMAVILGDMVGIMLCAAAVGVWFGLDSSAKADYQRRARWLLVPLGVYGGVLVAGDVLREYAYYIKLIGLFPIVWAALRGGIWGVAVALMCTSGGLVLAQLTGVPWGSMREDQMYLLATSFGGFALGAATGEQQRLAEVLRLQNERLIKLVDELNAVNREYEALAKRLMNAEERERSRIARELHDGLGQLLSAARLRLEAAKTLDLTSNSGGEAIGDVERILESAYSTTREIMQQLAPASLRRNGFQAAVADSELAAHMEAAGIHYTTEISFDVDQLRESAALNLFRIVQECANNTVKYAAASNFVVKLEAVDGNLHLQVRDDGKGFDATAPQQGMGLTNIKDRVVALNGRHSLESNRFGTLHRCVFPLADLMRPATETESDVPLLRLA